MRVVAIMDVGMMAVVYACCRGHCCWHCGYDACGVIVVGTVFVVGSLVAVSMAIAGMAAVVVVSGSVLLLWLTMEQCVLLMFVLFVWLLCLLLV